MSKGANINARSKGNATPLMCAISNASDDSAKGLELLIESGADVNTKSDTNSTPLISFDVHTP